PAIAVPETLPLPDAGSRAIAGGSDIGWATVIARGRRVIAGSISVVRIGDRSADDGTADQSARHRSAKISLRVGRSGSRHGRNGQGGDGSECHQCFPHGFTFLIEE